MPEKLQIAGQKIGLGESAKLSVNIARLPSHTDIDLNIHVNRAKEDGPVVLFSGGLHGDEINGIEIVRRIIDEKINEPLRGTIICLPIINIYGFINFSRYVPDGKDINRSFPGSKSGSLASRLAHFMTNSILPVVDYGLDFHTGGDNRTNFPQIRGNFKDPRTKELALSTNAPFIMHSSLISKSLRSMAYKMNKPFLVYEGGESMRMDQQAIEEGINCAKQMLHSLGMSPEVANSEKNSEIYLDASSWIRAKHSGIFHSDVESGEIVTKSQLLGRITDPFGDFTIPILSPNAGYIIGLNNTPIVHQGDALMHIGIEKRRT